MTDHRTLIADALADKGWTQAKLARKLKVQRQSIGGWVRGEEACPKPRQAQIAIFVGIKASEYFDPWGFAMFVPTEED